MLELFRKTWLPSVAMVIGIVAPGLWLGVLSLPRLWSLVAAIVVVTTLVWWGLVVPVRRAGIGRGAGAGALSAAIVFLVPIVLLVGRVRSFGPAPETSLVTLGSVIAMLGIWCVASAIGAVVGIIAVVVGRVGATSAP